MRLVIRFAKPALVAAIGLLGVAAANACSSFTADDGEGDAGLPDAATGGEDTSPPVDAAQIDASDAGDASDTADAFPATPLVHVTGSGKPFAIEATEVSVEQWNLFKGLFPMPTFSSARCPGKVSLGPPAGLCGATLANHDPMTCVDWCDANAYCTAIGRHLCGDVSGAALAAANRNTPANDEWYYACRGPGASTYPYGNTSDGSRCATGKLGPVPVGSLNTCVGAEPGLFDMSGNAAEWTDACDASGCLARGGSFKFSASDSTCEQVNNLSPASTFADIGFRCCTEP